jgi:predicted RNase H-like nuclease
MDEVLAFAAGQRQAFVAVSAPQRPNQGLMAQEEMRRQLNPTPRPGRWLDLRLAEYQLRQHNISIPQTYAAEQSCPNWRKMGFSLFRRLEVLGYQPCPMDGKELQALEVYPHACFAVLLGHNPFPKRTLEGRLQRQLVLHEQKLNVPDPMRFFEEITRHKLLKGILPNEDLYSPGELDALVAAYTAWYIANHPEQATLLGDPSEGQIVLPVTELKPRY